MQVPLNENESNKNFLVPSLLMGPWNGGQEESMGLQMLACGLDLMHWNKYSQSGTVVVKLYSIAPQPAVLAPDLCKASQ